ncbi:hypothetical protein AVEN_171360-1 [Araneus ventricosus]|uniref:Uncharacterized protein n=1 Tax=Araneus ventricosus TaxID=182803 RepID=A0A4Y2UU11_ARAVE|nr:hypothetical protein AVEN_171360-1 [Araneus ventricosus]
MSKISVLGARVELRKTRHCFAMIHNGFATLEEAVVDDRTQIQRFRFTGLILYLQQSFLGLRFLARSLVVGYPLLALIPRRDSGLNLGPSFKRDWCTLKPSRPQGRRFKLECLEAIESKDNEDIYSEDEDVLHPDFFRFTRGKRHVLEGWNVPTPAPLENSSHPDFSVIHFPLEIRSPPDFILYGFIPLFVIVSVCIFASHCIKLLKESNSCSDQSDSQSLITADISVTVHRPPPTTTIFFAQMHWPPTARNHFLDIRIGEPPCKAIELDSNHAASDNIGVSSMYPKYASSSQIITETSNAVEENPFDYSTVILNDLINSTQPGFPAVK